MLPMAAKGMEKDEDIIKMHTDIVLTDINGKEIKVEVQPPEYMDIL